ncbi:GDSL-type esterase/lipase family protein [Neobacillus bataviensis]|nr:GDSL-type esterase/lipase family protein [Neobacillus bataviensis]
MTMMHGNNITVRNVKIMDATADHSFQVNSSRNVLIEGCEFYGVPVQDVSRNYVECIQIDWCTSGGAPGWVSTAPIYDHTTNDGVIIRNCTFGKSLNPTKLQTIYTAIGSHSTDGGRKNKNILIEGCKFADSTYANITAREMENVTIRNNSFSSTDINGNLLHIDGTNNINVYGNTFKDGRRAIYANATVGLHVYNNDIYGGWSYQIFTTEGCENISIVSNSFRDFTFGSTSANAIIALRSAKRFFVENNMAYNVSLSPLNSTGAAQDTMFVFIYATTGDTSKDGFIGRNMVDDYMKIKLDSKVTYSSSVNVYTASQNAGLSWCSIGDSITNGGNSDGTSTQGYYQEYALPLIHNVKTHYKRGYSGYSATKYTNGATGGSVQDKTAEIETADIYTIFLGTNDFSRNAPIGSTADAIGKLDSFWGGLKQIYVDLTNKNMNATIIMITPMKRTVVSGGSTIHWNTSNTAGFKLVDYVNAIKEFASQYGLPVIDLFSISGVSDQTASTLLYDGLHPRVVGNARIGKLIGRQMNSLV